MNPEPIETTHVREGEVVFVFTRPLDFDNAEVLRTEAFRLLRRLRPQTLVLDFQQTSRIDSAGIGVLRLLRRYCIANGTDLQYRSVPSSLQYFLRYVESDGSPEQQKAPLSLHAAVSALGAFVSEQARETRGMIRFLGGFVLGAASSLYHFRRFRWRETLYYAQLSGADAMPIVFLLTFLMGLVMAFQAAVQLRQFGANIFVADLVSLAITRELGPVFTAVILAGRSGSAFAAEIGAMKVNEEIDALTVMGFNITQFLVLPKVFALAVCGPLLTLFANASGILGGVVVGVLSLDLTVASFLTETYQILTFTDVATGLVKSLVFAVLVALIGCFRGLQTKKGADSVGRQTTSAVVSGIFLIILADAVFTIIFHTFGL